MNKFKCFLKTNNKSDMILFLTLLIAVLPSIRVGSYGFPPIYLGAPFGAYALYVYFVKDIKSPKIIRVISMIFCFIILEILVSSLFASIRNDAIYLPTDIIQYIVRYLILLSFSLAIYKRKIETETFIKYFILFSIIAMLIGIAQWLPWPGRIPFIKMYPFRDGSLQIEQLNRPLSQLRMHGFAQHATSNGGIAAFFVIFSYSLLNYYDKYKKRSLILMVLSIINIVASMSRSGLIALVGSFLTFYIIDLRVKENKIKSTIKFLTIPIMLLLIGYILYINGNEFVEMTVYRWTRLFETSGGPRIDQINYFTSNIDSLSKYLFGLSKGFINNSNISYGVESDPIYIYIAYGLLGFILQYGVLVVILIYLYKNLKSTEIKKYNKAIIISAFSCLIGYLYFSIGFYFYREINIGHFPWILIGVAVGNIESNKKV